MHRIVPFSSIFFRGAKTFVNFDQVYSHLLKLLNICIGPNMFVFVALRPKSTAMVIAGRSVHLTTLFPGQA